jgi:hypothetical protein
MAKTIMLLGVIFVLLLVAAYVYTMPESVTKVSSGTQRIQASTANNGVVTNAYVQNNAIATTAEVL